MTNQDRAWRQFVELPPARQREVLDYISFLQTRHVSPKTPRCEKPKRRAKKLSAESYVGIWRGRKDMSDSVAWVRKSRQRLRTTSRG
jgi:hypothetical protein